VAAEGIGGHGIRRQLGFLRGFRSTAIPVGTLLLMDSQQIAALRREIEGIQELNTIYRSQKLHGYRDQVAYEKRQIRLEEIKQQLDTLRSKQVR
jgi:hypothetical protein